MKKIRIYVEGGGDDDDQRALLRSGFEAFLNNWNAKLQRHYITIITCGGRNQAYDSFVLSLKDHKNSYNMLLVDSEGPVQPGDPWKTLQLLDSRWQSPPNVGKKRCHLMVQFMESWLIIDVDGLEKFYGEGFDRTKIPSFSNVETIDRDKVSVILSKAISNIKNTEKRKYKKIEHAAKLLALADIDLVRSKAPHCDRLFITLEQRLSRN